MHSEEKSVRAGEGALDDGGDDGGDDATGAGVLLLLAGEEKTSLEGLLPVVIVVDEGYELALLKLEMVLVVERWCW